MTDSRIEPIFLDTVGGRLFVIIRKPETPRGCVLFVAPFAEEMNKTRRQIAETSLALGEVGYASIMVDFFGTGDSEGEFVDATWQRWKSNINDVMEWADKSDCAVDVIVATRLGCALAAESIGDAGRSVDRCLFWQPVASGRQFLRQFLRLRVAASLIEDDVVETIEGLRGRLHSGEVLEIAGYPISPALFGAIEEVNLESSLYPCLGDLHVFEVGRAGGSEMSISGRNVAEAAMENGVSTSATRIIGEPFWMATEVVTNRQLCDLSVGVIDQVGVP